MAKRGPSIRELEAKAARAAEEAAKATEELQKARLAKPGSKMIPWDGPGGLQEQIAKREVRRQDVDWTKVLKRCPAVDHKESVPRILPVLQGAGGPKPKQEFGLRNYYKDDPTSVTPQGDCSRCRASRSSGYYHADRKYRTKNGLPGTPR